MNDELALSPFTRSIVGFRGTVLLRRHESHVEHCRTAISRREHPRWSSQRVEYRVEAA